MITDWAETLGVEASFFLMDEERLRSNHSEEMTSNNCGSSGTYYCLMSSIAQQFAWLVNICCSEKSFRQKWKSAMTNMFKACAGMAILIVRKLD
ncbi:hypothetical protein OH492_01610 [Vibrio chagasii]|nr:hypothetical protein [Vibrio chagasii]